MKGLKWSINKKKWDDAINSYLGYTHKTLEEVTYRQAKNLLFFVSRNLPTAKFKRGQPVSRLSDYFKYNKETAGKLVACYFKRKGALMMKAGLHKRKGVIGRAYMTEGARGKMKFAGWQRDRRTVYFTKEMAIKRNRDVKNIINSRFGFIQLIPMKAVERLKVVALEFGINLGAIRLAGDKPNKKKKGEPAMVKVSKVGDRIDLKVVSAYRYRQSTTLFGKPVEKTAKYYDDQFRIALPKAIDDTIADMDLYIRKKTLGKPSSQWTDAERARFAAIGRAYFAAGGKL